jgi:hypothetical protein
MDHDFRDLFARHLDAAGDRRVLTRLLNESWPGGPSDRREPAAARWVRRWGPALTVASLPACSCAAGRCAVCN